MPYSCERMLDYRETDPDAHCGTRGYLELFQAVVTEHMAKHELGNNILPYKYGIGWMFTRYRLRIHAKADSFAPLELTTWVSGKPGRRFMTHEFRAIQSGETLAEGRLECCLFDLSRQRVSTPAAVGFPNGLYEQGWAGVDRFRRLNRDLGDAHEVFSHEVRYTDIDNNGHMNNLRYVNLVLDAFTRDELEAHPVADFEIHFLSQCREGETVRVWRRRSPENDGSCAYDVFVLNDLGKIASQARIRLLSS